MKIMPIAGAGQVPPNGTPEAVRTSRAVAAFNKAAGGNQPAQSPVLNQNAIGVEELGAIQPKQTAQPIETQDKIADNVAPEETQEQTPQETKEEKDPALTRQFAQLARQERAHRIKVQQERQALNAEREALKAEKAAMATKDQEYKSGYISRDRLKQDTLSVMAEAGVSYEELTQQIISQQPVDPRLQNTINTLKSQIEELKAANEAGQKSQVEQQQASYQAAVKQITLDAKNLVKSDPTAYEAISKTGTVKQVVKLIEDTYAKDGVLLSVEEAAQEVENYLINENVNMYNKINKIKQRIAQNSATSAKSNTQTPNTKQTQPQMKTLTNATSSSRQLSAKERAILAFKGQLKG